MQNIITITAANGIRFNVVFYPNPQRPESSEVRFFDSRYAHTEHGQFTGGGYYAESLLANRHDGYGLDLHGGVADWTIDAPAFKIVREWIARRVNETRHEHVSATTPSGGVFHCVECGEPLPTPFEVVGSATYDAATDDLVVNDEPEPFTDVEVFFRFRIHAAPTPEILEALDNLIGVMGVQTEDGLYSLGSPEAECDGVYSDYLAAISWPNRPDEHQGARILSATPTPTQEV